MRLTKLCIQFITCLSLCTLFAGCVTKQSDKSVDNGNLNSIVVLPVNTILDKDANGPISQPNTLDKGAEILNAILVNFFATNSKIRYVSEEQQEALFGNYNQKPYQQALHIGRQLHGDAVLTTSLSRFQERSGKNYSIDNPASVAFEYRLMLVETGETLCAGRFDETQQSITENLLAFRKAFQRGGQWVTAEQLANEGVKEKFSTCKLLQK